MLNSEWLVRMLAKSGKTPQDKLLALFDILGDWVDAPHIRPLLCDKPVAGGNPRLLAFLTEQANALSDSHPESLANQLYLIALGALHEELRSPDCGALRQARSAAATLLRAHRPQHRIRGGTLQRILAVAFLAIGAGLVLPGPVPDEPAVFVAAPEATRMAPPVPEVQRVASVNPAQVASLYDAIEKMRNGVCQYPQALMLPPDQRSVFLGVVMDGTVPAGNFNPQELHQLVRKVDCYYPPVALIDS